MSKSIEELQVVYSNLPRPKSGWKGLELGGGTVSDTGNSELYKTGNWVPTKLKFIKENCINCGLCWPVCPDDAIIFDKEGNMLGIDLDHCKDCGLCTEACPPNKNSDPEKRCLVFEDNYREDF